MIKIISYNLNDKQRLNEIERHISNHCTYYPNAVEWYNHKYRNSDNGCILMLNDDKIVGLALTKKEDEFSSKIAHLSIDEKYSRLGLGDRLLRQVLILLSEPYYIKVRAPIEYSKRYFKLFKDYGFKTSAIIGNEIEFEKLKM